MFQNCFPSKVDVAAQCESWADCESQDVPVSNFGWSYVDLPFVIDALTEFLIDIIATNESKTDQAKAGWNWQLKSFVLLYKFSKFFSKFNLKIAIMI